MESVKGFIKNYFADRTIKFYIALASVFLLIITVIIYAVTLGHLKEYISWMPIAALLAGGIAFVTLSAFRMSRLGAAALTAFDFIAFLTYIGTIYKWPVSLATAITNIGELKELPAIIVCAVLMLVCIVAANICAWSPMERKREAN